MAISSEGSSSSPADSVMRSGSAGSTTPYLPAWLLDMLDCPGCFKPFTIPVSQCVKGHPVCSSCCSQYHNECPSCFSRISDTPYLVMEQLIEIVKVPCLNSKYGCKEILSYAMSREHERSCAYEPCNCPHPGCDFDASYKDLYRHFALRHPASAVRFTFDSYFSVRMNANGEYKFLQEDNHTLFILNYSVQEIGGVVDIICMGPSCLQNEYSYELEVNSVDGSIKYTSPSTKSLPKWAACPPGKLFLVIPKDIVYSSWDKMQVCIRRKKFENWLESSPVSS